MIGYFSPQLVFQNPDINVESMVPGEPKYESLGLEYALTALCEEQSWAKLWSQATVDALAWKGVVMVTTEKTYAPRYAHGREVHTWDGKKMTVEEDDKFDQPTMVYIDAHDFFTDSAVKRNGRGAAHGPPMAGGPGQAHREGRGEPLGVGPGRGQGHVARQLGLGLAGPDVCTWRA